MRSSHPYSVLHLHSEGAAAITYKASSGGVPEPQFFYKSPKATGSLESDLKQFFANAKKDVLYINMVSEASTLHAFKDTTLIRDTDAFAQVLEAYSGIAEKDCDTQFLEAERGIPFAGQGPILVNCFKRSDYYRAQALASELGFENFKLFNNTLSILGALSEWRNEHGSSESVAILELGNNHSNVTICSTDGNIVSKKIPISVKDLAEGIQAKLELKFDSAALLLFYNGVFDFSEHQEAISVMFAEKLAPQIKQVAEKLNLNIDRLLISSLPPSYTWLNEHVPAAAGFNGFSADEFFFLKDLSRLGDYARNPGFVGAAFCSHSQPNETPWMIPLGQQSIAEACKTNTPFAEAVARGDMQMDPANSAAEEVAAMEQQQTIEAEPELGPEAVFAEDDVITRESPTENVEVISFNQSDSKASVAPPPPSVPSAKADSPATTSVQPIDDEESSKKRFGIIWGGIAALFIIGGASFFYFQNQSPQKAPAPVPLPRNIQETVNISSDEEKLRMDIEKSELAALEEQPAEIVESGSQRTITRPGREKADRKLTTLELAETVDLEETIQEATPVPEVILTGSLSIDSEPSGAEVLLNGIKRGKTPVTVDELEFGAYAIEFRLEGYVTQLLDVSIESSDTHEIKTELQLPLGTLEIETTPQGVAFDIISVDGVDRVVYSGTTPMVIPDVLKGEYNVQFKRHGWDDFTQPVSVRFNDVSRVDLVYPEGWLVITSTPEGASVFEKGIFLGKTPLRLKELKEGERTYTIRHQGYEDLVMSTTIESQVEKRLEAELLSWDREVDYKDLDIPPTQVKKSLSYTQRLVGKNAHRFLVEFVINQEGVAEDIEILETTYLRAHDRLKKDILKWKFEPGLRKERAVKTRVRLPIILGDPSKLPPTVELARNQSEDE